MIKSREKTFDASIFKNEKVSHQFILEKIQSPKTVFLKVVNDKLYLTEGLKIEKNIVYSCEQKKLKDIFQHFFDLKPVKSVIANNMTSGEIFYQDKTKVSVFKNKNKIEIEYRR